MSGWPLVPLGEILKRRKDEIDVQEHVKYVRLTIRMNGKGIDLRDRTFGNEIGTKRQFVARAGQLVLSKIDARNGAFGILPSHCDQAIITGNFWAFEINHSRLDSKFFEYFTTTKDFLAFCIRASEGTTNRRYLQEEQFLRFCVPLPPLAEQRRVSGVLDRVSAKISDAASLGKSVQSQIGDLMIALHCTVADGRILKMGEALQLQEDKVAVEQTGRYPQVGVRGFGKGLFKRECVEGTGTTYKTFNRLYSGCLVLSQVKGWEGAVAVCDSKLAGLFVSPEYRTFKCQPDALLPEYLAVLVRNPWFWGKLSTITRGVGARRERTRPERFLEMPLAMPTIEGQRQILSSLQGMEAAATMRSRLADEIKGILPATVSSLFGSEQDDKRISPEI